MTNINSWVRQARHRAKRHACLSTLTRDQALAIYTACCAYCDKPATTLDNLFPLSSKAPNVAANCVACCAACKKLKGSKDLFAFQLARHITEPRLLKIMRAALKRPDAAALKEYMRAIMGICT